MRVVDVELSDGLWLSTRRWDASEAPTPHATKPTAVLLPATGATAGDWDTVAEDLCRDRDVVAVDLRGHGASAWPGSYSIRSMAVDVTDLLSGLDGPVDLVGHSLGGLVAWWVASASPDRVRRLVLEDVGLLRPRPSALPSRPPGPLDFDWAVVEQVRPEIDDPDPGWPARARQISCVTLLIGGGPTSPVPQEHVADLAASIPRASVVTIEAGHLVHATEPDVFSGVVRRFLDA